MSGVKYDSGKAPMSLLSTTALRQVAEVLGFGAKKYAADNWRGGMAWRRLIDAAMRHLTAFADGEDKDPESGLPHLAHAACCLMFLQEYQAKGLGKDDRYKPAVALPPAPADVPAPRSSWSVRDDAPAETLVVGRSYLISRLPIGAMFECGDGHTTWLVHDQSAEGTSALSGDDGRVYLFTAPAVKGRLQALPAAFKR